MIQKLQITKTNDFDATTSLVLTLDNLRDDTLVVDQFGKYKILQQPLLQRMATKLILVCPKFLAKSLENKYIFHRQYISKKT